MKEYNVLVSFVGAVCGAPGQVIKLDDKAAADLLRAKYIEELVQVPAPIKTTRKRKKAIEE